ncbi:HD domain-containing protein [Rhizobium sp. BK377]|jgi:(p)ppGpp synthase/HD superfamily hydrolase|uniref:HD domain-containing protein n=1 Tax=Rhizobium sp. BK377 TaxID=2587058 RepID=UPI00162304B2|nr:HD domain-containing protein [Rhizobium sp. BK377]MBB3462771.1 (p)ppGpp synthase/HD superfamily hydrolase [Rhizobium sp. BK377]
MQTARHLDHARQVAMDAHEGQQDKIGNPYFQHCERVAGKVMSESEKVVAYLHDIPEKAPGWTIDRLREEGFSASVIAAVDALTRRSGENDVSFIRRAASNALARAVKRADLEDNRFQAERAGLDPEKFEKGLAALTALGG